MGVGRGLTDWLLQDAEHGMFPPPHAVPSLAGTAITDRTVMASMKIAEYNAVPAVNGGLNFMESLELHESICPSLKPDTTPPEVPSLLRRLRMRRRELSFSTSTTKSDSNPEVLANWQL